MSNPKLLKSRDRASEIDQQRLLAIREGLTILMLAVEEAGMEDSVFWLTQVEGELRGRLGGCGEAAAVTPDSLGLH